MQIDMLVLNTQLKKFLVLILLGFLAKMTGLMTDELHDRLNTVIMRVIVPALLISNMAGKAGDEALKLLIPMTVGGFVVFLFLALLGRLSGRLMGFRGDKLRVQTGITFMGAIGFFGLPLVSSLLGPVGTAAFGMFSIMDNLTVWTFGLAMSRGQKQEAAQNTWRDVLKRLMQPATIAVLIGLVLLILRVPTDGVVMTSLAAIGSCANPLAMLCIGCSIARSSWRTMLRGWPSLSVVVIRMLTAPWLIYRAAVWLGIYQPAAVCLTLTAAMPSSSMFALMCKDNGSTEADYASSAAMLTVLCSVFTIPLVVTMMG